MKKMSLLLICFSLFSCAHQSGQDHLTMATLWTQKAGEVKALSYQAFNIAKMELVKRLRRKNKKPLAVVVDVDETVLDNSPFQARGIITNTSYPDGWREWIDAAEAKPLPGAVEFLNYAKKRGVAVFYITNRKQIGREATIKNLKSVGFPVNPEHVMCRVKSSSKKERREDVLKKYDISLLMGDNIGDFSEVFELNNVEQ
jgi:5'-nucleotidase (lipoprotein e(P4) family)